MCTGVDHLADLFVARGSSRSRPVRRPTRPCPRRRACTRCLATHASHGLDGAVGLVWVHEWLALVQEHAE